VDKPLGLTLADKKGSEGGVVVASVSGGGNAAKAGIKAGDTVIYTSSFFGDELWPADKAAFTRTAINAKQNDVDFVIVRGKQADEINVKRLKARPSPPRFGRKLTAAQKARATHICLDWCAAAAQLR
jgi:S1-C subfamily serine protease